MYCDMTTEQLAAFTAGDMPDDRAADIHRHVSSCDHCRQRLDALAMVDSSLQSLTPPSPPPDALARIRHVLDRELAAQPAGEIMTLQEVAEFLRVEDDDLRDLLGDLPAFEIAGRIRVRRQKLLEWIGLREEQYLRQTVQSHTARIVTGRFGQGVA